MSNGEVLARLKACPVRDVTARWVYLILLANLAGDRPTQAEIAEAAGCCTRTVVRAIARLRAANLIDCERVRPSGPVNRYTVKT